MRLRTPALTGDFVRPLEYLPIATFDSVMGFAALSDSWRTAHGDYGLALGVSDVIAAVAVIAFLLLVVSYAIKWIRDSACVASEFNGSDYGASFASFLMSVVLVSGVIAPLTLPLARAMWCVGAAGSVAFLCLVVTRWVRHQPRLCTITPLWLVPVVALMEVPIPLSSLGWGPLPEISLAIATAGFCLALPLLMLSIVRASQCSPVPDGKKPSMLVAVSPFALGVINVMDFPDRLQPLNQLLYLSMILVVIILVTRLSRLPARSSFKLSWWVGSFPLASSSLAAIRFAESNPTTVTNSIALALLIFATVVTAALLVLTLHGLCTRSMQDLSGDYR